MYCGGTCGCGGIKWGSAGGNTGGKETEDQQQTMEGDRGSDKKSCSKKCDKTYQSYVPIWKKCEKDSFGKME